MNPGPRAPGGYDEVRSGLTARLMTWFLASAGAEVICLVLAVVVNPVWAAACGVLLWPLIITAGFTYRNWPTGIRVDEAGITIGAIRSGTAPSRRLTVYQQSRGVFTAPWSALSNARVVTDPAELLSIRRHFHTFSNEWGIARTASHCDIGVMCAPFMRAALVAEVFPPHVTGTELRSSRVFTNFSDGRFSHKVEPRMSSTWIVPTRNPQALEEALKRCQQ